MTSDEKERLFQMLRDFESRMNGHIERVADRLDALLARRLGNDQRTELPRRPKQIQP
jgi:hypothetical protein